MDEVQIRLRDRNQLRSADRGLQFELRMVQCACRSPGQSVLRTILPEPSFALGCGKIQPVRLTREVPRVFESIHRGSTGEVAFVKPNV